MTKSEVSIKSLNLVTDKSNKFLEELHDVLIKYDIDYSVNYEINPA
jgi:hypothetical protein